MDANELRIGNLVFQEKITGTIIFEIKDGYAIEHIKQFPDYYEPIPLTEEWLLRFGFESLTKKSKGYKVDSYSYSGNVSLILNHDGVRTWTNFWQGNEMRYVHQLQNLYFALTGEELEYNTGKSSKK